MMGVAGGETKEVQVTGEDKLEEVVVVKELAASPVLGPKVVGATTKGGSNVPYMLEPQC